MAMMPTREWKKKRNEEILYRIRMVVLFLIGTAMIFGYASIAKADWVYEDDTYVKLEHIPLVEKAAAERGICPEFIEALIEYESGGDPNEVSSAGCVGLMQISPRYSNYTKEELLDPAINIEAGTDLLLELFEKYEDPYSVLMAYNEGEYGGALERAERGEYSKYARRIVERSMALEKMHGK